MKPSQLLAETIELHQALVRCPSLSGQEAACADRVEEYLRAGRFENVWRDRFGSVIGVGQGSQPGPVILFDAHMDVVPIGDAAAWQHDPFGAELNGGRIWGRGATDTKASLAAILTAVNHLQADEFRGSLVVVGSVGEEAIEGSGLEEALEAHQPDFVVIGEPTDCRIGIGQKGRARLHFTAGGRSAHSSTPEAGENALLKAAEMLRRMEHLPLPEMEWLGKGVLAALQISSRPFPSASTIPYTCSFDCDRRLIAGETAEAILAEYAQAFQDIPNCQVALDEVSYTTYTGHTFITPDFHAGWLTDPDSHWVKTAQQSLKNAGLKSEIYAVPYCTNGSTCAQRNIPQLIFGPSTIHLAHVVDEYIEVDELERGLLGFMNLAKDLGRI